MLRIQQFLLCATAMDDLLFQLVRPRLQIVVGALQRFVAMLNFREHRVESVDQTPDFVIRRFCRSNAIVSFV
jgi:hypothetical protein